MSRHLIHLPGGEPTLILATPAMVIAAQHSWWAQKGVQAPDCTPVREVPLRRPVSSGAQPEAMLGHVHIKARADVRRQGPADFVVQLVGPNDVATLLDWMRACYLDAAP